jgi:hypothetical protein
MYMKMKRQPNYKSYWEKEDSIFYCPIVSNIMTRKQFVELHRCLHITNPATYKHMEKGEPKYDKLKQVRWLINEIRNACMREWSLEKFVTIDEMMVCYKGSYNLIRQHMPKKPEKWRIMFWILANSASKIVYRFEIYCRKNLEAKVKMEGPLGEASTVYG